MYYKTVPVSSLERCQHFYLKKVINKGLKFLLSGNVCELAVIFLSPPFFFWSYIPIPHWPLHSEPRATHFSHS